MAYNRRKTVLLENDRVQLTLLPGGGHIAAVTLKANGANALWDPPWETIDPSAYDPAQHPQYGADAESRLLAGITGHNLCCDFFGPPSAEEAAAGLTVHGEASVVDWHVAPGSNQLHAAALLPLAGMRVERTLRLAPGSQVVTITETIENMTGVDRPIGWTQHVTLGPPFLAKGKTIFHAPVTRAKVLDASFDPAKDRLRVGAEFQWPKAPLTAGGETDLRTAVDAPPSGTYTAQLLSRTVEHGYFTAFSPDLRTTFGYVWKRNDFPWLGIWEENFSRQIPPWNGQTHTRGMEFGVSPFPESRRAMVDRARLFEEPAFRWIAARSRVSAEYCLFIAQTEAPVEKIAWSDGFLFGGVLELKV